MQDEKYDLHEWEERKQIPVKDKSKSMELDIKKNSDKIFFLFTEDSVVQKLFEQIHPDLSSTTITNPRGDVIWTIYEVSRLV